MNLWREIRARARIDLNLSEREFWELTWPELTSFMTAWRERQEFWDNEFAYLRWVAFSGQPHGRGVQRRWKEFRMLRSTAVQEQTTQDIMAQLEMLFTERI